MNIFYNRYRSKLLKLPFGLLFAITLISLFGLIILWSAAGGKITPWALKQLVNFCLFFPVAIFIATIDLKIIFKFSYLFFILIILLLCAVEVAGSVAMGGKRWIDLGVVKLQPSEPAKLAIVLMLARYFHQLKPAAVNKFINLLPPIVATIIPAMLIIKQPDLGTGLITLIVAATIFFAAGVNVSKFITVGIMGLCSLPIVWKMMYEYQRARVMVFLNPERDPLSKGYNIIQSKIAIGSGGLFGKGLTHGTQSHLDFLPEHQTDFIFAFIAEELGFIGCIFLLLIYLFIIFSSLSIAINCRSVFGKLVAIGIIAIFFSHIFINIAMVMGLLPAVGIPLPFMSYGGTMMASMLLGFGVIMNIQVHQHNNI